MWQPFSEEHEQFRKTVRAFAEKELAPHAEEWEETTFPDWVFQRMGELGFLGLDKPEAYGGQKPRFNWNDPDYSTTTTAPPITPDTSVG